MALSAHAATARQLSAFGGKAGVGRRIVSIISAAFDPERS